MKKYVLKKDLPTFNKGETFIFDGDLWQESDNILVYSQAELDEYPNILKDWFEEIPEHKRWRAENEQEYFYIDDEGFVSSDVECFHSSDDRRFALGNYSKTAEEAGKARDWLIAFTILRDDVKGFKPDWEGEAEYKYFVAFCHTKKELWVGSDLKHQSKPIYFKSRKDAEASIKAHEKEWLTYFGVEDEK